METQDTSDNHIDAVHAAINREISREMHMPYIKMQIEKRNKHPQNGCSEDAEMEMDQCERAIGVTTKQNHEM